MSRGLNYSSLSVNTGLSIEFDTLYLRVYLTNVALKLELLETSGNNGCPGTWSRTRVTERLIMKYGF